MGFNDDIKKLRIRETQRSLNQFVRKVNGLAVDMVQVKNSMTDTNDLKLRLEDSISAAEIDELLGLYRRNVFDRDLQKFAADLDEAGEPIALIMVDLDKFKLINDSYGHPVGDTVLQFVAAQIKRTTGSKGKAYRYGGEELAIILPNYAVEETVAVAERLRGEIEAASIGDKNIKVTASFGVAQLPSHGNSAEALLEAADSALYDAKALGRNVVRISGEPPPLTKEPRPISRRLPDPNRISDVEVEQIRLEWFRAGYVVCPRDGSQLRVNEFSYDETNTPDLDVSCPCCDLHVRISAPYDAG